MGNRPIPWFVLRKDGFIQLIDLLVKHAQYLITMDEQRRIIRDGALAIHNGFIKAVGKTDEIDKEFPEAREVINAQDGVITPGFIDGHFHTTVQLARGLGDNTTLPVYLHERIYPVEASLSEEESYISAVCALIESVRHGTTCLCDPGAQKPEAVVRAVGDMGSRAIVSRSLTDMGGGRNLPGTFNLTAKEAVAAGEAFVKSLSSSDNSHIRAWFSLRTERMVSDELSQKVAQLAEQYQVGIISHMCSAQDSVEHHQKIFSGQRPIERYEKNGLLGPNLLLIHAHWLESEEMDLLATHQVKVVDCPTACVTVGMGGFSRATQIELLKRGICVCLGCDQSGASNTMDLLRVGQYFRVYQDILEDSSAVTPELILELLTINGAKALLWEDEIGSLEVGKRADLIIFDTQRPEWVPLHNPVSTIANATSGDAVKTVVIDGKIILLDGQFISIDAQEFLKQGNKIAAKAAARLGLDKFARPRWPIT